MLPKDTRPLSQRVPLVWEGEVRVSVFLECLCAAHLSNWVHSPFQDRSGLMVVGPPGNLKTALLKALERNYANVLELSDINQKGLTDLRAQLTTGRVRTLVLLDLAKLYERNPFTAQNAEGTLKAIAAEGFAAAAVGEGGDGGVRGRVAAWAVAWGHAAHGETPDTRAAASSAGRVLALATYITMAPGRSGAMTDAFTEAVARKAGVKVATEEEVLTRKLARMVFLAMQAREELGKWLELRVPGLPLDAYKSVRVARGILGTALKAMQD